MTTMSSGSAKAVVTVSQFENHAHMAFFDVDDEIGRRRMFHRVFLPSLAQTAVGRVEFRSELRGDVRKRQRVGPSTIDLTQG